MIKVDTQLLLQKRDSSSLTQGQIAKNIGVAQSTYTMIETGHRLPSVKVAVKLGHLLGFNWWELYVEINDDNKA